MPSQTRWCPQDFHSVGGGESLEENCWRRIAGGESLEENRYYQSIEWCAVNEATFPWSDELFRVPQREPIVLDDGGTSFIREVQNEECKDEEEPSHSIKRWPCVQRTTVSYVDASSLFFNFYKSIYLQSASSLHQIVDYIHGTHKRKQVLAAW